MSENLTLANSGNLGFHIQNVLNGNRRFENAAQLVSRMILEKKVEKKIRAGKPVYDFEFFRQGKKSIVGWYEEINDFVHFVKDAAEGGPAKEYAFVLVGEPGNGKTFFVDYICSKYREFLSLEGNRKYTFSFTGLDKALGYHEKVAELESVTYEDPMILAMNLFEHKQESMEFLSRCGFNDISIEKMYRNYRPLGASTEYLWHKLLNKFDGNLENILEHIKVVPVSMRESLGTITGKYSAKDIITSSSVDLLGEESLQHILLLNPGDPNRFDLRRGALARVAGSGIHFSDELFRNKRDLVQVYLGVIQDRQIVLDGFIWPIDVLIIATSNNDVYNEYLLEKTEKPITDRCRICYVSHNTDYNLQRVLTGYSLGNKVRTTILGEEMHEDPNLNFAISVAAVLTRLPISEKLTPVELMKLEAGEVAGDKGTNALTEVKDFVNAFPDVTKRWGQKGLGHRDLGRILQILSSFSESNEGKCRFAKDVFRAAHRVILDYVTESADKEKYIKDLKIAKLLYREHVKTAIFNAYRGDAQAIRKDVMAYVNMVIGSSEDSENLGPDSTWRYFDRQAKKFTSIKIDPNFMNSVEGRLGINTDERRNSHRNTLRRIYGQKINTQELDYDFMDNESLVRAVTDVRLNSDVAGAASLVGALANRQNDENLKIYSRMIDTMINILGYCPTCAEKTIEYFCEKQDEG